MVSKWAITPCFQKKSVFPPNHPLKHRVFHYFHHPNFGCFTPLFLETPLWAKKRQWKFRGCRGTLRNFQLYIFYTHSYLTFWRYLTIYQVLYIQKDGCLGFLNHQHSTIHSTTCLLCFSQAFVSKIDVHRLKEATSSIVECQLVNKHSPTSFPQNLIGFWENVLVAFSHGFLGKRDPVIIFQLIFHVPELVHLLPSFPWPFSGAILASVC